MAQLSNRGTDHPEFSRHYDEMAGQGRTNHAFAVFRRETAGRATGRTLEVGAGGGYNFEFYDPQLVERVEATEPDAKMLEFAQGRAAQARVPITVTQARAESLPFPDGAFDSVVATLVFCSVEDTPRGLAEIARVLKPGGRLLLADHVRSSHALAAGVQSAVTPITKRVAGNCHWNRDTERAVRLAGFADVAARPITFTDWYWRMASGLLPIIVIEARNNP